MSEAKHQGPPPMVYLFAMLAVIWGITLAMCWRQAELCEKRTAGATGKCGMEWQLAIVTSLGMGQSLLGLWTNSPNTPRPGSQQVIAAAMPVLKQLRDGRGGGSDD